MGTARGAVKDEEDAMVVDDANGADEEVDAEDGEGDWVDDEEEDEDDVDYRASSINTSSPKLKGLIKQAEKLKSSRAPFLHLALGSVSTMQAQQFKLKTLQNAINTRCEMLDFLCAVAQHEATSGTRPLPGTFPHLILFHVLDTFCADSQEVERFAALPARSQAHESKDLAKVTSEQVSDMRAWLRFYKDQVGIKHSKARQLAGLSEKEDGSFTANKWTDSAFRAQLDKSWFSSEWDDERVPDLQTLKAIYAILSGIDFDGKGTLTAYKVDELMFEDEKEACAWHVAAEEPTQQLYEDLSSRFNMLRLSDTPAKLCQWVIYLCRSCNESRAAFPLIALTAVIREQLEGQPNDTRLQLALGKVLSALALIQESDHISAHIYSAQEVAKEAVGVLRPVYQAEPDRYLRPLADALLRVAQTDLDDKDDEEVKQAIDAAEEAIRLYEEALKTSKDDLELQAGQATAYKVLGIALNALEEDEAASKAVKKSVDLFRHLAEREPSLYKLTLSHTICLLSDSPGEDDDAAALALEAIEIMESEAERWPTLTKLRLIDLYLARAITLTDKLDLDGAEQAADKSYALLKSYAAERELDEPAQEGVIQVVRGAILNGSERYGDGLKACKAAEKVYVALGPDSVDGWSALLGLVLTHRAFSEWMLGKLSVALKTGQKAVRLLNEAAEAAKEDAGEDGKGADEPMSPDLVLALAYLGGIQRASGDTASALRTGLKAVEGARAVAPTTDKDETASKGPHDSTVLALSILAATYLALGKDKEDGRS